MAKPKAVQPAFEEPADPEIQRLQMALRLLTQQRDDANNRLINAMVEANVKIGELETKIAALEYELKGTADAA